MDGVRWLLNPDARRTANRGLFSPDDYARVARFYDDRPTLAPTPLFELPHLAASLGVSAILVKDESHRFGLNAFKVLGVRFAVDRLIQTTAGPLTTLACATAGNHGRAVAHVAHEVGLAARIYIPAYTEAPRVDAIRDEGADVVLIDGTYEDAVRQCAADADRESLTIVSDTSWPGYEEVPRQIMLGYTRLLDECATRDQFFDDAIVIVQAGVGGLAAGTLSWLAYHDGPDRPFTIVAEPDSSACVMTSIAAGGPTPVPGVPDTIMGGLRCAEISPAAWPALGLADACLSVSDDAAREAMRRLAAPAGDDQAISAGPSGACGLAALLALAADPTLEPLRFASGFAEKRKVILFNTERGSECGIPPSHERTPGLP